MFVVTKELQEFIDDMKKMSKILKNPKSVIKMLTIGSCLLSIYFGCIILADLLNL